MTCGGCARSRVASGRRSRYPEIGYLGNEVLVQQYVCGLQVTVNHRVLARVQIVHAFGNLWAWTVDDIKVGRG